MRWLLVSIVLLACMAGLVVAATYTDTSDTDWNAGTLVNFSVQGTGDDANITGKNLTGSFTSQIFDAGSAVSWDTIDVTTQAHYGFPFDNTSDDNTSGIIPGVNTTGLVLYYKFDNNSAYGENSTHVYDYSGNGNNGTVFGGVTFPDSGLSSSRFGKKINFDETAAQYVNMSPAAFDGLDDFTISYYAEKDDNIWQDLLNLSNSTDRAFLIRHNGYGGVHTEINGSSLDTTTSTQRGLYTFIREGAQFIIYDDYELVRNSTITGTQSLSVTSAILGMNTSLAPNDYPFDGRIEEFTVWNRALSADEVRNLYRRISANLTVEARACDDAACSGESFVPVTFLGVQELSQSYSRYFQYRLTYLHEQVADTDEVIQINSVTITNSSLSYALPITQVGSYANYSFVTANYTANDLSLDNATCTVYHNVTGVWRELADLAYNVSEYTYVADNGYLTGHGPTLPVGTYGLNVTCVDDDFATTSNVTSITIGVYNTTLVAPTPDTFAQDVESRVYANFTSDWMNVSGVGFTRSEIGLLLWNSTDVGFGNGYIDAVDYESDGFLDDIAYNPGGTNLIIFERNGTLRVNASSESVGYSHVERADLDGDGYFDEVVAGGSTISVYAANGSILDTLPTFSGYVYPTVGDADGDGLENDIYLFHDSNGGELYIYNSSNGTDFSQKCNMTSIGSTGNALEIRTVELNASSSGQEVIMGKSSGFDTVSLDASCTKVYNVSGYTQAFDVFDFSRDGSVDTIVTADHTAVRAYYLNLTSFDSNDVTYADAYELRKLDLNNDGYAEEFVVLFKNLDLVGFNSSLDELWNTTLPVSSGVGVGSLSVADVTGDGYQEIIVGGASEAMQVFNASNGAYLFGETINLGYTGYNFYAEPSTQGMDLNKDGLQDIAISSADGYLHTFQEVTCDATFSDAPSTEYAMSWNDSLLLWQSNRTFSSAGSYDYNISCAKGGYESQTLTGESLTVDPVTLFVTDLSDSITTYSNYSEIYANFSVGSSPITTASCSVQHNATGVWRALDDAVYNASESQFVYYADNGYLSGHGRTLPVGTYLVNTTCVDDTYGTVSNTTSVTIDVYNTTLVTSKDSFAQDIESRVYANFTSDWMNVSGVGFTRSEIGKEVWRYVYAEPDEVFPVTLADFDGSGKRDYVIFGGSNGTNEAFVGALRADGTSFWNYTGGINTEQAYSFSVGDFNNDSYDSVLVGSNRRVYVLNSSGDSIWYFLDGAGNQIFQSVLYDYDGDGLENDFYISGNAIGIGAFNSSDGLTWSERWDQGGGIVTGQLKVGDFNNDGNANDVFYLPMYSTYDTTYLYHENGTALWNYTVAGGYISSVERLDGDDDGDLDSYVSWLHVTYVFNETGGLIRSISGGSIGAVFDSEIVDYYGDGTPSEVASVHEYYSSDALRIKNTSAYVDFELLGEDPSQMAYADIDGDGHEEFLVSLVAGNIMVYTVNLTYVDAYYTDGTYEDYSSRIYDDMITTGDLNNDGLADIVTRTQSANDSVQIFQQVSCAATYSDAPSTEYAMTWNNSLLLWQSNRTFSTAGTYDYNITCEKGGYESQTLTGESLTVDPVTLFVTDLSDSITTYSNYSEIYANFSVGSSPITTASCSVQHNATGVWRALADAVYNASESQFVYYADNGYLSGHGRTLPVGTYLVNTTCVDDTYGTYSNTTSVTIDVYNTTLATSESSFTHGVEGHVYANFTSDWMNVSGVGLSRAEIGQYIWSNASTGYIVTDVEVFDQDRDGQFELASTGIGIVRAYYRNGSEIWNYTGGRLGLHRGDLENSGYQDSLALSLDTVGNCRALDRNGAVIINNASAVGGGASAVGDIDGDGLDDIICGRTSSAALNKNDTILFSFSSPNSISEYEIGTFGNATWASVNGAYNASGDLMFNISAGFISSIALAQLDDDESLELVFNSQKFGVPTLTAYDDDHSLLFNASLRATTDASFPYEIALFDYNGDGYDDMIATLGAGQHVQAYYHNGTSIWNVTMTGDYVPTSALAFDFDGDGSQEIAIGARSNSVEASWIVLNRSGDRVYELELGKFDTTPGGSPDHGTDPGQEEIDINGDGILDVFAGTNDNKTFALQSVACDATFSDAPSTEYAMTWNDSLLLWQSNRTFSSAGFYTYNVTCSKNGYESQTVSDQVLLVASYSLNITVNEPSSNSTFNNYTFFNVSTQYQTRASSWLNFSNDLVGYWNGTINATHAIDYSGYGNHLTLFENFTSGAIYQERGEYFALDGDNDYAAITVNNTSLDLSNQSFTMSLWSRYTTNISEKGMLAFYEVAEVTGLRTRISGLDSAHRYIYDSGGVDGTSINCPGEPNASTWYHFTATYNGSHHELYRDGVSCGSTVASSPRSYANDTLYIGTYEPTENSRSWDGQLDEIMIFNRSLDTSEIQALYDASAITVNFTDLSNNVYNYSACAVDQFGLMNCTSDSIEISVPTDTCTYTGGTWSVNLSDSCRITSDTDLGANELVLQGSGSFTVASGTTITAESRRFEPDVFDGTNVLTVEVGGQLVMG